MISSQTRYPSSTGKSKKKWYIAAIIIVLLLGAGAGAYWYKQSRSSDVPDGISGTSQINYDPPTKDEQKAGDEQKPNVVDQQKADDAGTTYSNATLIISDASYYADSGNVEVRASVSNIIEDGGTCTATFTQGSQTVTATSKAFGDARSTQCGNLNAGRDKFPSAGTWNLTLDYKSPTATGQQKTTVTI